MVFSGDIQGTFCAAFLKGTSQAILMHYDLTCNHDTIPSPALYMVRYYVIICKINFSFVKEYTEK